jgi:hypothetical protein
MTINCSVDAANLGGEQRNYLDRQTIEESTVKTKKSVTENRESGYLVKTHGKIDLLRLVSNWAADND